MIKSPGDFIERSKREVLVLFDLSIVLRCRVTAPSNRAFSSILWFGRYV